MAKSAPNEARRDRRPRAPVRAVGVHRASTARPLTNERPSRIAGIGAPSAASALGITSTVRRGVSANGRFVSSGTSMCSRCSAPWELTCANRFVARPKIPIARRREHDVAGSRRGHEMHDLHDRVGIVGLDREIMGLLVRRPAHVAARAERIAGFARVVEAALRPPHRRVAAIGGPDDDAVSAARRQEIHRRTREQRVTQFSPPRFFQRRTRPRPDVAVQMRHRVAAHHHRDIGAERHDPGVRHRSMAMLSMRPVRSSCDVTREWP